MTMSFPEFDSHLALPIDVRASTDEEQPPLPRRPGLYRHGLKRVFDVMSIVMAAPIVVPVIVTLAVLIARDGGSPFFRQTRIGRDGRSFRMWKLRSMVKDADARMAAFLAADPDARAEWDKTQKLKSDPRVTPLGRFLRRASLDELPQLWNVLIGDMSLVGPRPMMVCQRDLYPGAGYFALRPGITGYWQTSGRNHTSFEARAEYDDAYEADLSLLNDIRILLRTVGVVVKCTGY